MTATMGRYGVYGGTFDPVHNGHLAVARAVLELLLLDQLIFVPAYQAPHKRTVPVTRALHRYAMLALATADDERLKVSPVEIDAPETPYTIDTLSKLRAQSGENSRGFFIMGADSWEEITTWHDWEKLLSNWNHVVVTRPGSELSSEHVPAELRSRIVDLRGGRRGFPEGAGGDEFHLYLTDLVEMDVSATGIRKAVRSEEYDKLKDTVPPVVARYIRKYGLYTK